MRPSPTFAPAQAAHARLPAQSVASAKIVNGEAVEPDEDEGEGEGEDDEEEEYTVEAIVGERKVRGKVQYLVSWLGFAEQTWEPLANVSETAAYESWEAGQGEAKAKADAEAESESESSEAGQTKSGRGKKRGGASSDEPRYQEDDASYEEESDESVSDSSEGYVPEGRGSRQPKRQKNARPLSERQLAAFSDGLASCEPGLMAKALEAVVVERPELHRMLREMLEFDD